MSQNCEPTRPSPTGVRRGPPVLRPGRLKERIAWRHNADCKQDLDLRIQEILLKEVNNAVFHAPHLHQF
jgi:hypothetical protein